MGEGHKRFWWGNVKERYCLEQTGLFGRIILKEILKWNGMAGLELMGYSIGRGGCCEWDWGTGIDVVQDRERELF
jgi:hypothetical protein